MLGRRWSFATDDVPILGFFPTMLHGLWAMVLIIVWIVFGKHQDCYDHTTYTVVLAGLLTTFTMFFIIGCWAIYEGLKGVFRLASPDDKKLRLSLCCSSAVQPCFSDEDNRDLDTWERICRQQLHPLKAVQSIKNIRLSSCMCTMQAPCSRRGSAGGCPT